jgi:TetR/AcrR family transcriptional regulator, transcriptional repressor for nem operon
MSDNSTHEPSKTAEEILGLAQALIQSRGYSAFSYQDIANSLGIRKASIHYHFPSKAELGIAVVDRYAKHFRASLESIAADEKHSSMAMLDHYMKPYFEFAKTSDKVCLCGALAGEIPALPDELRKRVERFFEEHQAWLAEILARGLARKEFVFSVKPAKMARLVFGALQGALLVKRTTGDASQLKDVTLVLKSQLSGGGK